MGEEPVIAYVRATYTFVGQEAGDLNFKEDDVIYVTKKDDSGWWKGRTDDGKSGNFPYNYVEEITEADVKNRTSVMFATQAAKEEDGSTSDKLVSISVSPVRGEPRFNVEANLERNSISAEKSMMDFRVLEDTLKTLYPDYDKPLPPLWADNIYENDQANKKKAEALVSYLERTLVVKGLGTEQTEYAVVNWLNPDEKFNIKQSNKVRVLGAADTAAEKASSKPPIEEITSKIELAEVKYRWEANDAVELSLQEGTFVLVQERNTANEGWWTGVDASGSRGEFPSNHVKVLTPEQTKVACLGNMKVKVEPQPFTSPQLESHTAKASDRSRKTENNFKITSLDAFDEMLTDGFTMLTEESKLLTRRADAVVPQPGNKVILSYVAYVWDCQKQRIIEFASSDLPDKNEHVGPLVFLVGNGPIKALDRAVQNLEMGQKSRVVIRPEMGYGEVGSPPLVPPNCHLIYDLTLDEFASSEDHPELPAVSSGGYVGNRARRPPTGQNFSDI